MASTPMTKDPTMAAMAVAVSTRSNSMPVPSEERIPALTTRMYDIARKVEKADGELARDIKICADRLNAKTTFLDDDDLEEIRRAT